MDILVTNRRLLADKCISLTVESLGADGAPQTYRPHSVNPDLAGMWHDTQDEVRGHSQIPFLMCWGCPMSRPPCVQWEERENPETLIRSFAPFGAYWSECSSLGLSFWFWCTWWRIWDAFAMAWLCLSSVRKQKDTPNVFHIRWSTLFPSPGVIAVFSLPLFYKRHQVRAIFFSSLCGGFRWFLHKPPCLLNSQEQVDGFFAKIQANIDNIKDMWVWRHLLAQRSISISLLNTIVSTELAGNKK